MYHNLGEIACPRCHAASQPADTGSDRWQCPSCQALFFLRRCAACEKVSHVPSPHGWNRPWDCAWCQEVNSGFSQNRDPAAATVADYVATAPPQATAPPPQATAPPPQAAAPPPQATAPPPQAAAAEPQHTIPLTLPAEQAVQNAGDSWFPLADGVTEQPRRYRRRAAAAVVSVIGVAAIVVISFTLMNRVKTGNPPAQHELAHAVDLTASEISAVRLNAPPGSLTIMNASSDQVTLTGHLTWSGQAPKKVTHLDKATRVLTIEYVCEAASPCSGTLELSVPASTSTALDMLSGQVTVSGLAGPLAITASHVNVTATGLRSPDLVAVITSGQLMAGFSVAPARVGVALTSAQATVRLPATAAYQVNQQIISGNLDVGVPRSGAADHVVSARITGGGLELLPALLRAGDAVERASRRLRLRPVGIEVDAPCPAVRLHRFHPRRRTQQQHSVVRVPGRVPPAGELVPRHRDHDLPVGYRLARVVRDVDLGLEAVAPVAVNLVADRDRGRR